MHARTGADGDGDSTHARTHVADGDGDRTKASQRSQEVQDEGDVEAGHGDLQVVPVTDEVGQHQDDEEPQSPEQFDHDASDCPLSWAHQLHACITQATTPSQTFA